MNILSKPVKSWQFFWSIFIFRFPSGFHLCPGGQWDGASVQSPLCSQRPGGTKLPDQQSEACESVITQPKQGRLQQVCQKRHLIIIAHLNHPLHVKCKASVQFYLPVIFLCSEYYHYRQAWIPLRWLPADSVFEDDFSTKSDVWAFGVLMWEVFSYGEMPYTKLSDDEVLEGQCSSGLFLFSLTKKQTEKVFQEKNERCCASGH